ncbi:MAG: HAD family hydrolase [Chloroflexi bacterium]|nr:HAD family hydrolase [Chloroflexota bacterium]
MTVRAVFFDLDDTLCDTTGTRTERAERCLARLRLDHPDVDPEMFVERVLEPTAAPRGIRGVPQVVDELGLANSPAGRQAIRMWFFVDAYDLLHTLPGVRETLPAMSDRYSLSVVTNGDDDIQRGKFRHLALAEHISHLVISANVGYEKPDPRIFEHALELVGVPASEALVVGDRLETDVVGAKAAGISSVWFDHWNDEPRAGDPRPDAVITAFDQLPDVLASA